MHLFASNAEQTFVKFHMYYIGVGKQLQQDAHTQQNKPLIP